MVTWQTLMALSPHFKPYNNGIRQGGRPASTDFIFHVAMPSPSLSHVANIYGLSPIEIFF